MLDWLRSLVWMKVACLTPALFHDSTTRCFLRTVSLSAHGMKTSFAWSLPPAALMNCCINPRGVPPPPTIIRVPFSTNGLSGFAAGNGARVRSMAARRHWVRSTVTLFGSRDRLANAERIVWVRTGFCSLAAKKNLAVPLPRTKSFRPERISTELNSRPTPTQRGWSVRTRSKLSRSLPEPENSVSITQSGVRFKPAVSGWPWAGGK